MSRDEVPPSSHAAEQAWFSMLLVNDPNTALVGALRPTRLHPIWVALRRPFERPAPVLSAAVEEMPGLRPRPRGWLGVGLLLALGGAIAAGGLERVRMAAETLTASAPAQEARLGTTQLEARPAPPRERAADAPKTSVEASAASRVAAVPPDAPVAIAARPAPTEHAPRAAAPEAGSVPPRASTASAQRAKSVKKKAPARRVRRASGRGLARSR